MIAKQRTLPAAEAVEGHRHRDRHVDADHANLHAQREFARAIAVAREQRYAIAEFVFVHQVHRRFEIRHAGDRQYRSENFFLVNGHVRFDLVEQAAAEEEPVLVSLDLVTAAVDDQLCAFLDAEVHITAHLVEVLLRDQRTHFRGFTGAGVDFQGLGAFGKFLDQLVGDITHGHRNRDRHAALARGTISRTDQRVHGLIEVGIGHHDQMILRAAERLHAFATRRAGAINVFRNRRRADKADRGDS